MVDISKLLSVAKSKANAIKPHEKANRLNSGVNRIVLLPGWKKGREEVFYHDFALHYIKDEADKIQAVYICHDKTFGENCPVCEAIGRALMHCQDSVIAEKIKGASSKQIFLVNALLLDSENPSTPVALELPKSVFSDLLALLPEWGEQIFNPQNPQVITITKDGKGLTTNYVTQPSAKTYPMPAGVMDKLVDLDAFVAQKNDEIMRKAVNAVNTLAGFGGAVALTTTAPSNDVLTLKDVDIVEDVQEVKSSNNALDELDELLMTDGDDLPF